MTTKQKDGLLAIAFFLGGIGLLIQGFISFKRWRGGVTPTSGLGRGDETLADAQARTKGVIQNVQAYQVGNVKQRVQLIAGLARADHLKPEIREAALAVLTRKCGVGEDRTWCLPQGTLLLTQEGQLRPIESIRVGDVIMGDSGWTRVLSWFDRGRQPLLRFELNNGSALRCTGEHSVFVVPKRNGHGVQKSIYDPWANVPGQHHEAVELSANKLKVGMDLLQPHSPLPFGTAYMNADLALIMGAYISEGSLEPSRVSIAGIPNGKGLREQVIAAAERLGLTYSVNEHCVRIREPQLVSLLEEACGRGCVNKHLPALNFDKATMRALLIGINADAHTPEGYQPRLDTTSPQLALQYRIMQRMFGCASSIGVQMPSVEGKVLNNPLYRVGTRGDQRKRGSRVWARITAIFDDPAEQTYDIETESRRIYLPESDVVVHNCVPQKEWKAEVQALFEGITDPKSEYAVRYTQDPVSVDLYTSPTKTLKLRAEDCDSLTATLAAELMSVGYSPQMVTIATPKSPNGDFSHILLKVPKPNQETDGSLRDASEEFVILDPSMPERGFGWEPPGLSEAIKYNRPAGVISKLKVFKF